MATSQDVPDRLRAMWKQVVADDQDASARAELVEAVLSLDTWFAVPQTDEKGRITPAAAVIERVPMLLTFTTAAKATEFAADQNLGDLEALELVPREVVAQHPELSAAGILAVILDPADSGIFVPLDQLAAAAEDQGS